MRTAALLLVLLVATEARGGSPSDELGALIEHHEPSAALRRGAALVQQFPDDAELHYRYGVLLLRVFDAAGARRELERASALAPNNAKAYAALGAMLADSGDEAAAERATARALALNGQEPTALRTQAGISLRRRLRLHSRAVSATTGTPAAIVAAFVAKAIAGPLALAVADYVEANTIDALHMGQTDAERTAFLNAAAAVWRERTGTIQGWDVTAIEAPADAVNTTVTLELLIERGWSAERIAEARKRVDAGEGEVVFGALLQTYHELEPADRAAMFERLTHYPAPVLLTVNIELVRAPNGWRIHDAVVVGSGDRVSGDPVSRALAAAAPPLSQKAALGQRVARIVSRLVIGAVALGALFFFLRRRRTVKK